MENTRQVLDKTHSHKASVHEARGPRSVPAMQQANGFPAQPSVTLQSGTQLGFSAAVKERDLDAKLRGGGQIASNFPGLGALGTVPREQGLAATSRENMLDAKLGLGAMPPPQKAAHVGREQELDARLAKGVSPPALPQMFPGLRRPMTLPFPSGGLDFSQQGHMGSHSALHVPSQAGWTWSQLCVMLLLAGCLLYCATSTDLLARVRI